uniref:Uncharacterized protein n=1 Tax=Triticum urartu TaxID=4572 RepID=A0A8R7QB14_TRIUA
MKHHRSSLQAKGSHNLTVLVAVFFFQSLALMSVNFQVFRPLHGWLRVAGRRGARRGRSRCVLDCRRAKRRGVWQRRGQVQRFRRRERGQGDHVVRGDDRGQAPLAERGAPKEDSNRR